MIPEKHPVPCWRGVLNQLGGLGCGKDREARREKGWQRAWHGSGQSILADENAITRGTRRHLRGCVAINNAFTPGIHGSFGAIS